MLIADVHTHIFPDPIAQKASDAIGDFYSKPSDHIACLNTLSQQEDLAGIDCFATCSSATAPSQVAHINEFIAQCSQATKNLVPIGSLYPTMEHWEAALEHLQELGMKGVKIHPDFQKVHIDDPRAVDMYRGIAKTGLPVLFHMGDPRYDYSAPERLTNLIRQVPDLVAIAAHFGGWNSWDRSFSHTLPENVFYDTSSSLMYLEKEKALAFIDKIGPHRFLFGSDFPMWTPKQELERFLSLGLDQSSNEQILYLNFKKLFLA